MFRRDGAGFFNGPNDSKSLEMGGIFDGFEGYRGLTAEELDRAVRTSTVVLDTNVLLGLYRVLKQTREENLAALHKISSQLFMPAQVQREFWRLREKIIREVIVRDSAEGLREAQTRARSALNSWGKQVFSKAQANALQRELDVAFKQVLDKLRSGGHGLKLSGALKDVKLDPVVQELELLFAGRVGRPFDGERLAELVAQGRERFARRIPPGFADAEKPNQSEEGTGDYLIWEQIIAHAQTEGRDILFVTQDTKEDWWRLDSVDNPIGPRIELVNELRERSGVRLVMAEPAELWDALATEFDLPKSQSTVDDVERIGADEEEDIDGLKPWTPPLWETLLAQLEESAYTVRAAVLREAARDPEGFIPRQRVYELGGYDQDRLLVGFTRPIIGATRKLVASGDLPPGLEPALSAYYTRAGKAEGFVVPQSVIDSTGAGS